MNEKDIGYLLKVINDKMRSRSDADLKSHNLTMTQSRVMAYVSSRGGKSTQKEIEKFLQVSHPTVVGIVSRMEQGGYLTTTMVGRDKYVSLTHKAMSVWEDMHSNIKKCEARLVKGLSGQEIAELRKTLLVIYNNLKGESQ